MRTAILTGVAIAMLTLAVYWQVGGHEFVNYDDDTYVYANVHVTTGLSGANVLWAFTALHAANWHPLTWLTHMADVSLYGLNPGGHHFTNLFLHIAATLLLLALLYRTTGALWRSAFVSALFALHPSHVESVAWVAERKDVLSACFGFLTLLLYAEYAATGRRVVYWLALGCFVLGLMAKPMLVTLPLLMLLLDYWPLQRSRSFSPSALLPLVREKLLYFGAALLSALITIVAQQKGASISSLEIVPMGLRVANAITSCAHYLRMTLWPADLAVFYPLPAAIPWWQVAGALAVLLAVSWAVARESRQQRFLAVGWSWFLITLVPVIGLVHVGAQAYADRYTYIPAVGLYLMAAWGVPLVVGAHPGRQRAVAVLGVAVVLLAAALTWRQLGYWQDGITLNERALAVTTGNYVAHNNLGVALAAKGRTDEAIEHYRQSLAINPNKEITYVNLGNVLLKQGQFEEAFAQYRRAAVLNPAHSGIHNNLGTAYYKANLFDAAIDSYHKAIALNRDYGEAYNNLGLAYLQVGRFDEAIEQYRHALAINPNDAEAGNNLAYALSLADSPDRLIAQLQQALAASPRNADLHLRLGLALAGRGRDDEALRHYRTAVELDAGNADAHNNLGIQYAKEGRYREAIDEFRKALAIDPQSVSARRNLDLAVRLQGGNR